jgi:hypothetical protein
VQFDAQRLSYTQARGALFHIASVLGNRIVWLPAYHCPALVEPFLAANTTVSFYPVTTSLEPDFGFLRKNVSPGDAVTAVRYFGFDSGIQSLSELCKKSDCVLIEDLAHAPFAHRIFGDIAVTSLWKFYPIRFGAELCLSTKSVYRRPLEELHRSLPGRTREFIAKVLRKISRAFSPGSTEPEYRYFDPRNISGNIGRNDVRLIGRQPVSSLAAVRRSNYLYLGEYLNSSSAGKPLFPTLPDDVAPYVFPFLLNDEKEFARLRRNRLQIYRWEEISESGCKVSNDYRQRLVQLPCHQDLDRTQLSRIVDLL